MLFLYSQHFFFSIHILVYYIFGNIIISKISIISYRAIYNEKQEKSRKNIEITKERNKDINTHFKVHFLKKPYKITYPNIAT